MRRQTARAAARADRDASEWSSSLVAAAATIGTLLGERLPAVGVHCSRHAVLELDTVRLRRRLPGISPAPCRKASGSSHEPG